MNAMNETSESTEKHSALLEECSTLIKNGNKRSRYSSYFTSQFNQAGGQRGGGGEQQIVFESTDTVPIKFIETPITITPSETHALNTQDQSYSDIEQNKVVSGRAKLIG